jgi:tetratricopeptide (TPR) repeat protein
MGHHIRAVLAMLLLLTPFGSAQLRVPAEPQHLRFEPPPANASPAELENRGDELRVQKAYSDALDYYTAALRKQPSAAALKKAGICELQLQHLSAARKYFEHAIKLDPADAEAHNNLGVVYFAQKKPKKAIGEYRKAIRLREDSAPFHANLGTAYMATKHFDKMTAEYSRALELDPEVFQDTSAGGVSLQLGAPADRARYNFLLAKLYAKMGRAEDSLRCLRRAMEDGYKEINGVYQDADLAALRKDPRFAALMAQRPQTLPQ